MFRNRLDTFGCDKNLVIIDHKPNERADLVYLRKCDLARLDYNREFAISEFVHNGAEARQEVLDARVWVTDDLFNAHHPNGLFVSSRSSQLHYFRFTPFVSVHVLKPPFSDFFATKLMAPQFFLTSFAVRWLAQYHFHCQ